VLDIQLQLSEKHIICLEDFKTLDPTVILRNLSQKVTYMLLESLIILLLSGLWNNVQVKSQVQELIILLVRLMKIKFSYLVVVIALIFVTTIVSFWNYRASNGINLLIKNQQEFQRMLCQKLVDPNQELIILWTIIRIKLSSLVDMVELIIIEHLSMIFMNLILKVLNGENQNQKELHHNLEVVMLQVF